MSKHTLWKQMGLRSRFLITKNPLQLNYQAVTEQIIYIKLNI